VVPLGWGTCYVTGTGAVSQSEKVTVSQHAISRNLTDNRVDGLRISGIMAYAVDIYRMIYLVQVGDMQKPVF